MHEIPYMTLMTNHISKIQIEQLGPWTTIDYLPILHLHLGKNVYTFIPLVRVKYYATEIV